MATVHVHIREQQTSGNVITVRYIIPGPWGSKDHNINGIKMLSLLKDLDLSRDLLHQQFQRTIFKTVLDSKTCRVVLLNCNNKPLGMGLYIP